MRLQEQDTCYIIDSLKESFQQSVENLVRYNQRIGDTTFDSIKIMQTSQWQKHLVPLNKPANMLARKLSIRPLVAVSALILCLSMACSENPAAPPHSPTTKFAETETVSNSATLLRPSPTSSVESAEVSRIVDGDTIKVILGSRSETVSYTHLTLPTLLLV